jgi:hypothetical protein
MRIPLRIWHNVLTSTRTVTIGRMAVAYVVALLYLVIGWFVLAGGGRVVATSGAGVASNMLMAFSAVLIASGILVFLAYTAAIVIRFVRSGSS